MTARPDLEATLSPVDFGLNNRDLLRCLAAAERTISTMSAIIEVAPYFAYWKDTDLRFLGANGSFLTSLGCEAVRDIYGKTDADFLTPDELEVSRAMDRGVLRSGEPALDQLEERFGVDGQPRQLRTSRWPFADEDGQIIGIFGISEDVTEEYSNAREIQVKARQLAEYAALDELTGLPNRRSLNRALRLLFAEEQEFSVLFVDLDGFKVINDSLGHEVGDRVVQAVGTRLLETIPSAGLIARLGGDEFGILLTGDDIFNSGHIASTLVTEFRKPIIIDELDLYCSASVGVARRAPHHHEPADILRDADLAMYEAKANGRDRFEVFSPEMFKEAEEGLYMRNRVGRAVRDTDFELFYQPIYETGTNRLAAVEALLRMPTEDGTGMEPAGRFIPHLEQTGLILPVGEWIVEQALAQLAEWQTDFRVPANLSVNVNLSPLQLGSGGLSGMILDTLDSYNLRPERLTVEMTETAVADNSRNVRVNLERLREAGVRIAMDDFGVGQSSLALLGDLPFDIVKIDKHFVQGIGSPRHEQLLLGVIRLLTTLDITSLAEGVEDVEQYEWLNDRGCEYIQGYYLGRPVRPEDL